MVVEEEGEVGEVYTISREGIGEGGQVQVTKKYCLKYICYIYLIFDTMSEYLFVQVTNLSLTINISCSCSGGREAEVARGVAKGVATLLESKLGKPS